MFFIDRESKQAFFLLQWIHSLKVFRRQTPALLDGQPRRIRRSRQTCTLFDGESWEYEGPGKRAYCSTANPGDYEGWSELEEALSRKSALEETASRRAELEEAVIRRVELEEAVVRRAELEKSSNRRADLQDSVQRRSNMLGPQGQGNSSTPCAACKLLRRRCAQECPFSPYFSPLEPQKFACVHKIFGASNVSKMLLEVPESQRADAASSLVYEANARIRDPVYGCMGAISALQHQAQTLQAELQAVRSEILRYRCHESMIVSGDILAIKMTGAQAQEIYHPSRLLQVT